MKISNLHEYKNLNISFLNKYKNHYMFAYNSKNELVPLEINDLFKKDFLLEKDIKGFYVNDFHGDASPALNQETYFYNNYKNMDLFKAKVLFGNLKDDESQYKKYKEENQEQFIKLNREKIELTENLSLDTILALGFFKNTEKSFSLGDLEHKNNTLSEIEEDLSLLSKELKLKEKIKVNEKTLLLLNNIEENTKRVKQQVNEADIIDKNNLIKEQKLKEKRNNQFNDFAVNLLDKSKVAIKEKKSLFDKVKASILGKQLIPVKEINYFSFGRDVFKPVDELYSSDQEMFFYTKENEILLISVNRIVAAYQLGSQNDLFSDIEGLIDMSLLNDVDKKEFLEKLLEIDLSYYDEKENIKKGDGINIKSGPILEEKIRIKNKELMNSMSPNFESAKIKINDFSLSNILSLNTFKTLPFFKLDIIKNKDEEDKRLFFKNDLNEYFKQKDSFDDSKREINGINYHLFKKEQNDEIALGYLSKIKRIDDPTFILKNEHHLLNKKDNLKDPKDIKDNILSFRKKISESNKENKHKHKHTI